MPARRTTSKGVESGVTFFERPRLRAAGEAAVVIELGEGIDPDLNARVRALDEALRRKPFPGYREAIPSYRSLLVFYDPALASFSAIEEEVERRRGELTAVELPEARLKKIPAVYDGEDLDEVARAAGITREEVIRLHSEQEYLVFMVGFTPGFAYMGMTAEPLALPRRKNPRTRVPEGSVAIAMGQTGIYPSATPGGWRLLGRAEHRNLFDPTREPPSFLVPGDRVRFVPVDRLDAPARRPGESSTSEGEAVLEVEDGGLLTTVQDRGRFGYLRYGVPVAGAVDLPALEAANRLVGNDSGAAALEVTAQGPRLRCLRPCVFAVTGADLGAVVERSDLGTWPVPAYSSFLMRPGNLLSFGVGSVGQGARAYLAVAGGIAVPEVLGSRSTYLTASLGGYRGRALAAGDLLRGFTTDESAAPGKRWPPPSDPRRDPEGPVPIRIVWGPQDDYFDADARRAFTETTYVVGDASDRMGYRLDGPPIAHRRAKEIVSDGMMSGGIQVPPNGRPIVMLADCATTGGYPKIATVIGVDLPRLGQMLPGDRLRFRAVTLAEAYALRRQRDLETARAASKV